MHTTSIPLLGASYNRVGTVYILVTLELQWNLSIKDTLGPANLSMHCREVVNSSEGISTIGKFIFGV